MVSGMRTGYLRGLNKGLGSKFRDYKKVPESDKKYLKKAGGHIGRNVVLITIKMKTTVRIIQII